jgi:arylformamidase
LVEQLIRNQQVTGSSPVVSSKLPLRISDGCINVAFLPNKLPMVIDLTHLIQPGMTVYPDTVSPIFERANTIEKDGFLEHKITMSSHTGTHIDAPSHILVQGAQLDDFGAGYFIGKACVIEVCDLAGGEIPKDVLIKNRRKLAEIDFLLFHTGWNEHWGTERYFMDYPVLEAESAQWLTENFSLRGIGIDAISLDRVDSAEFPVHSILLQTGMILIENLTNLDSVGEEIFRFICLPLKTLNADGAPVRAIALVGDL